MLVAELLARMVDDLKNKTVARHAVPETFPLLRTIQFVAQFKDQLFGQE